MLPLPGASSTGFGLRCSGLHAFHSVAPITQRDERERENLRRHWLKCRCDAQNRYAGQIRKRSDAQQSGFLEPRNTLPGQDDGKNADQNRTIREECSNWQSATVAQHRPRNQR